MSTSFEFLYEFARAIECHSVSENQFSSSGDSGVCRVGKNAPLFSRRNSPVVGRGLLITYLACKFRRLASKAGAGFAAECTWT